MTVKQSFDTIDYSNTDDKDNIPMKHKNSTVENFKKIGTGTDSNGTYFSRGTCSRLKWDEPAPTLVPGHSSFQIHPSEHRSITVREGACLTGFPNTYQFCGSHSSKCVQIGNAIPVQMAEALAKKIKEYLMLFD
jgi:DNA (cytosine-5)-methyltransferase 1